MNFKKILAMVLTLVIMLGALPFTAFAQESAPQKDEQNVELSSTDIAFSGETSIGNMLVGEFEDITEQTKNSGNVIYTVEIEEDFAFIELSTSVSCTLFVGIYTEDCTDLISSGYTEVTPLDEEIYITLEKSLPTYFYIKAYLVDSKDFSPLSAVYNNPMYTQEMQEFLSKTTDDFEEEKVVNFDDDKTNNFAVLSDEVLILEETETNKITYADTASQIYILENIDQTVSSLKVGDTFSGYYNGELFIITVGEISIDGTVATVLGAEAELEEVFDYVKLDGATGITEDTVDPTSCGEGITFNGYENTATTYGMRAFEVDTTKGLDAKFKIDLIKVGNDQANVSIKGNFNLKFVFSPKLYISTSYKYIELKLDYDLSGGIEITGEIEIETPIAFLTFGLPGVRAEIAPKFVFSASGSVGVTGTLLKGTFGYGWYSDVGGVNLCSTPKMDIEIKAEVTVFIGLRIDPKIKLGEGFLAEVSIETNLGAEAKATLGGSFSEFTDKSQRHTCDVCLEGEIYGKFDLLVKGSLLKNENLSLELTLLEVKVKITDFYLSFTYNDFGFSVCPHLNYKLSVVVSNSSGKAIKDAIVSVNDESSTTSKNGKTSVFLPNGSYIITVSKDGFATKEKNVTIKNDSKTVNIILEEESAPSASASANRLSVAYSNGAVIDKNGDLYMWGSNYNGRIDNSGVSTINSPKKIMSNVASVSVGDTNAVITTSGDLLLWGSNYYGELGDGTLNSTSTPKKIMSNVVSVDVDSCVSGAITANGDLYMWGRNYNGQIGDGTKEDALTPKKIMSNVASVAIGGHHSAAITKNGELYMWGNNDDGELGNDSKTESLIPIKIMEDVTSVSLGDRHSAAVTTDGTLYTWGDNYYNQGGCGTSYDKLKPQLIMYDVAKISMGTNHSAAITTEGDLYLWGNNGSYQIGDGTFFNRQFPRLIMSNIADVSLGAHYSVAIDKNNVLYGWGNGAVRDEVGKGKTPKVIDFPSEISVSTWSVMRNNVMPLVDDYYYSSFENLEPNTIYNFYIMKDRSSEDAFGSENLLYINQAVTDENGIISFEYYNDSYFDTAEKFVVKFKNALPENVVSDVVVTANSYELFINVATEQLLNDNYENITAKVTLNGETYEITDYGSSENSLTFYWYMGYEIEEDSIISVQLMADYMGETYEYKESHSALMDSRRDINIDGSVDSLDLTKLKKGLFNESFSSFEMFDPNADGEVNIIDLVNLQNYLLS